MTNIRVWTRLRSARPLTRSRCSSSSNLWNRGGARDAGCLAPGTTFSTGLRWPPPLPQQGRRTMLFEPPALVFRLGRRRVCILVVVFVYVISRCLDARSSERNSDANKLYPPSASPKYRRRCVPFCRIHRPPYAEAALERLLGTRVVQLLCVCVTMSVIKLYVNCCAQTTLTSPATHNHNAKKYPASFPPLYCPARRRSPEPRVFVGISNEQHPADNDLLAEN